MMLGCFRQLLEVPIEARTQHATLGAVGAGSREHYEIAWRQIVSLTKRFASEALELVAIHGSSRGAA
jgi:hypothetical protein